MIRLLICVLSFLNLSFLYIDEPSYVRSYTIMDYNTGIVLKGKQMYQERSVASISKIMTAIIAIESERIYEVVEVDEIIYTIEGSSLYLEIGQKISILDLVYGLLLRSGNDASVIIGKSISNSIDEFVILMNKKAKEIGMEHTTFNNPSGLDIFDEGNMSCSYDMCLLMRYCMHNELFRQIEKTKEYKNSLKGRWKNKNKLLFNSSYCIGGKTGYTKKAIRTLVTIGKDKEKEVIICTLDAHDDFSFHKNVYENLFNNYIYIVFLKKGNNYLLDYVVDRENIFGYYFLKDGFNGKTMHYLIDKDEKKLKVSLLDNKKNFLFQYEIREKIYIKNEGKLKKS